jgi:trimethylamine--corrinoid protein Co-methyltransferase
MIYGLGMLESDETLAVNVIKETGPFGDFLCHKHTLQRMRSQSQPEFIDRTVREAWEKKGSMNAHQKALEKVKHILKNHKPEPLPREVLDKIHAIVIETEEEVERQK